MKLARVSFLLVAVCFASSPALADEEFDATSYPRRLVDRPLVLPPSMFEVNFGGMSNAVASDQEDAFRSRIDFRYGFGTRFMFGLESDLLAFPTEDFAVNDATGWLEYNFHPNVSGRAGGYMVAHDDVDGDLDPKLGLRFALPMKFPMGESMALVLAPSLGLLDGQSILTVPAGLQLQLFDGMALLVEVGLETTDFEFEGADDATGAPATWKLPLSAGAVLAFTRKIDLTVSFVFDDVANDSDRRWLLGLFSFRG